MVLYLVVCVYGVARPLVWHIKSVRFALTRMESQCSVPALFSVFRLSLWRDCALRYALVGMDKLGMGETVGWALWHKRGLNCCGLYS